MHFAKFSKNFVPQFPEKDGEGENQIARNKQRRTTKRSKEAMKTKYITLTASIAACLLAGTPLLQADDAKDKLEKAKNLEKSIRQAQPPQESTGTKESAAGLNADGFRPKQQPIIIKEPPSPVRKVDTKKNLNPNNDPDVARGLGKKN